MQRYSELLDQLPEVKDMGYVRTHRAGNTGIGKTLEDLLNIKENNFAGPNGYNTELKSGRKGSSSMLTLFTKSPLPPRINRQLVEKFGKSKIDGKKALHTTANAVYKNSLYGQPAFIVGVYHTRIQLDHDDYGDLPTPYWDRVQLEKAFRRKYPHRLLYVKANCRGRGEMEEFHYNEAWLMSGFSFARLIELLRSGQISVDIRLGQYPDGRLHDHGTGFRVKPDDLQLCFERREQVL